jgi:hypothetical protein
MKAQFGLKAIFLWIALAAGWAAIARAVLDGPSGTRRPVPITAVLLVLGWSLHVFSRRLSTRQFSFVVSCLMVMLIVLVAIQLDLFSLVIRDVSP